MGVEAHVSKASQLPLKFSKVRFITCCSKREMAFQGTRGHFGSKASQEDNDTVLRLEEVSWNGLGRSGSGCVNQKVAGRVSGLMEQV